MTPEDWAAKVHRENDFMIDVEASRVAIADAIRQSVTQEREACAIIAKSFERPPRSEDPRGFPPPIGHDIAVAIRARKDGA